MRLPAKPAQSGETDARPSTFYKFFDLYPLQDVDQALQLGVSVSACSRIVQINSRCTTFKRCMIISVLLLIVEQSLRCRFGWFRGARKCRLLLFFTPIYKINKLKIRVFRRLKNTANYYKNFYLRLLESQ